MARGSAKMRFGKYPAMKNMNAYINARIRSRLADRLRMSVDSPRVPASVDMDTDSRRRRTLSLVARSVMCSGVMNAGPLDQEPRIRRRTGLCGQQPELPHHAGKVLHMPDLSDLAIRNRVHIHVGK